MIALLDSDYVLSYNDQWKKLDEKWGEPVDLETEDLEDFTPSKFKPVFSSLDLKTTFDSPSIMKTVKRNIGRQLSKNVIDYKEFLQDLGQEVPEVTEEIPKKYFLSKNVIDYKEFLQDLQQEVPEVTEEIPKKHFYYISGQILSAMSVEDICDRIDDIFKSIEQLCSTTSTIRKKQPTPEVNTSILSYVDLSFDDTTDSEKEKGDSDDVDRYIDEAFEQINSTMACVVRGEDDEETKDSVTTLVKKFSSVLNYPHICSPRRKRQCSEKFKDLAQFWKSRVCDIEK